MTYWRHPKIRLFGNEWKTAITFVFLFYLYFDNFNFLIPILYHLIDASYIDLFLFEFFNFSIKLYLFIFIIDDINLFQSA